MNAAKVDVVRGEKRRRLHKGLLLPTRPTGRFPDMKTLRPGRSIDNSGTISSPPTSPLGKLRCTSRTKDKQVPGITDYGAGWARDAARNPSRGQQERRRPRRSAQQPKAVPRQPGRARSSTHGPAATHAARWVWMVKWVALARYGCALKY